MNVFNILGSISLGTLADKAGNRNLFIIALALGAFTSFWLIFIQGLWMLYLFAALFGLAWGSATAQQSPLIASVFGMKSHGLILGTMSFINTLGFSLGGSLAGYIFDVNGSYRLAFIMAGILNCAGLLLMFFLRPTRTTRRSVSIP